MPEDMVKRVEERRAQLAADFLRRFDSTTQEDATLYFSGASKDEVVPVRAGYQLGVLVVRELAQQHSIQTMAHWSQAEAKPKVRAALEEMSAGRYTARALRLDGPRKRF